MFLGLVFSRVTIFSHLRRDDVFFGIYSWRPAAQRRRRISQTKRAVRGRSWTNDYVRSTDFVSVSHESLGRTRRVDGRNNAWRPSPWTWTGGKNLFGGRGTVELRSIEVGRRSEAGLTFLKGVSNIGIAGISIPWKQNFVTNEKSAEGKPPYRVPSNLPLNSVESMNSSVFVCFDSETR